MANQLYPTFLQGLMEQYFQVTAPWTAAAMDLFVCGVDSNYTFSAAHSTVEDLGINVVLSPVAVPDVEIIGGVLKAGDAETDVTDEAGGVVAAAVLFCANDDGSQLIAYIDEGLPTQLPMTLLAGKVKIHWNESGIFRI